LLLRLGRLLAGLLRLLLALERREAGDGGELRRGGAGRGGDEESRREGEGLASEASLGFGAACGPIVN
jgi:hypothetical protein